jgi:ribosomal-protein-alanine N-acetyltransferase
VFLLCYRAEPEALWVARSGLGVAGYVLAPSDMGRIYRVATFGGHLWRWLGHWLRGDYGFGWSPLRVLLLDKYAFLRSSVKGGPFPEARILSIGVDPAFHGRGIGSALLAAALDSLARRGARRVRLEVRPGNVPAVRMYERAGFRRVGEMADTRGPWWVMELPLPRPGPGASPAR